VFGNLVVCAFGGDRLKVKLEQIENLITRQNERRDSIKKGCFVLLSGE